MKTMNRRYEIGKILGVPGFCLGLCLIACAQAPRPQPPYRTLFSNDLTNVVNCTSSYSPAGAPFDEKGLFGMVDETAGVGIDTHILQPAYGWVPYWKSRLYPAKEHATWFEERYGFPPGSYTQYMLNGGDIVGEFVQRCREKGLAPFISLRMNDTHEKMFVDLTREEMAVFRQLASDEELATKTLEERRQEFIKRRIRRFFDTTVSRFYMSHPEYRLNETPLPPQDAVDPFRVDQYRVGMNNIWNWAISEVRRHRLDFITEVCENYDIEGFELDFLRHNLFFKKDLPKDVRLKIMTAFIREVRAVLDRTARDGKRRWLSVRVPFRLSDHEPMGLDVKQWHEAGVDIFNLSCYYVTQQQHDLAKIHRAVPEACLYLELTHTLQRYRPVDKTRLGGRDGPELYILTKPEQYYTAAHLAYSRGARGVTAFNFVYYRAHEERVGGTVAEPPFEVFRILHDPALAARQPQHYFLSRHDHDGKTLRLRVNGNFDRTYSIDMAPPAGGWTTDGRLRIQVEPSWNDASCRVYFNDVELPGTRDISEPYPTKLDEGLGDAKSLRAWTLPKSVVRDGVNRVRIVAPDGPDAEMIYLDIGIR
jgi:hypothetical protein